MRADTNAIAVLVNHPPATIRSWARRGHLTRVGRDHRGRALYDVDQALRVAERPTTALDLIATDERIPA